MNRPSIIVSCSGEGLGHVARLGALVHELVQVASVYVVAPKTVHSFIKQYWPPIEDIYEIPLFGLVKRGHQIDHLSTVVSNLGAWACFLVKHLRVLCRYIRRTQAVCIITDFDPVMSVVGKLTGVVTIAFNHQGILKQFPVRSYDALSARVAYHVMVPFFHYEITSSFYQGDVGPLLRPEIVSMVAEKQSHIVAYCKPEFRDIFNQLPEWFPGEVFYFFPDEKRNYLETLRTCKAVISSAGHQFLSEVIFLKKPVLVLPQESQYEQTLNAQMVNKIGVGMVSTCGSFKRDVTYFLAHLSTYRPVDMSPDAPKQVKQHLMKIGVLS